MNKHTKALFDKRQRFSIRRLTVGVASVVVGCVLFGTGNHVVLAEGTDDVNSTEVINEAGTGESLPVAAPIAGQAENPTVASRTATVEEAVVPASSTEEVRTALPPVNQVVPVDLLAMEATSEQAGHGAILAGDDNWDNYWQSDSSQDNTVTSQTLTVALKEPAAVTTIRYSPRQDGGQTPDGNVLTGFIEYSDDKLDWRRLGLTSVTAGQGTVNTAEHTFTFTNNIRVKELTIVPVTARYFRLTATSTHHSDTTLVNKVVSAADFLPLNATKSISASDVVAVDPALTEATSYSASEGATPAKATDGNLSSGNMWSSDLNLDNRNPETRQRLIIGLVEPGLVSSVSYTPRSEFGNANGNIKQGYIEYSLDKVNWQRVTLEQAVAGTDNEFALAASTNTKHISFTPVIAKFIRLTATQGYNRFAPANAGKVVAAREFTATARKIVEGTETYQVPVEEVRTDLYHTSQRVTDETVHATDGLRRNGRVYLTQGGQQTGEPIADLIIPQGVTLATEASLRQALAGRVFVGTHVPEINQISVERGSEISDDVVHARLTNLPEGVVVKSIDSKPATTEAGDQGRVYVTLTYPGPSNQLPQDVVVEIPVLVTEPTVSQPPVDEGSEEVPPSPEDSPTQPVENQPSTPGNEGSEEVPPSPEDLPTQPVENQPATPGTEGSEEVPPSNEDLPAQPVENQPATPGTEGSEEVPPRPEDSPTQPVENQPATPGTEGSEEVPPSNEDSPTQPVDNQPSTPGNAEGESDTPDNSSVSDENVNANTEGSSGQAETPGGAEEAGQEQSQPAVSIEVASERVTVEPHSDVYQDGNAVKETIKDRLNDTLAELRYGANFSLPQTIDFRFDQALELDKMEIVKRTPGNGTLTKYKVAAYAGEELVYESGDESVDFAVAVAEHNFVLPKAVDKVSLTLLEARISAETIKNTTLTLRDVVFYEMSKTLLGKKIENNRIEISGSAQNYHTNHPLTKMVDGDPYTYAEFAWTNTVKLPEDIRVRLDGPTKVTGYALHKRFARNGSLVKYKVTTYLGDQVVQELNDIPVEFKTTLSSQSLSGQPIDSLVFTILEAKDQNQRNVTHQLTLRELELFEEVELPPVAAANTDPDTGGGETTQPTPPNNEDTPTQPVENQPSPPGTEGSEAVPPRTEDTPAQPVDNQPATPGTEGSEEVPPRTEDTPAQPVEDQPSTPGTEGSEEVPPSNEDSPAQPVENQPATPGTEGSEAVPPRTEDSPAQPVDNQPATPGTVGSEEVPPSTEDSPTQPVDNQPATPENATGASDTPDGLLPLPVELANLPKSLAGQDLVEAETKRLENIRLTGTTNHHQLDEETEAAIRNSTSGTIYLEYNGRRTNASSMYNLFALSSTTQDNAYTNLYVKDNVVGIESRLANQMGTGRVLNLTAGNLKAKNGEWNAIAVTYNQNDNGTVDVKLYVNGVLAQTATATQDIFGANLDSARLGAMQRAANTVWPAEEININNFTFYNRALDADEVANRAALFVRKDYPFILEEGSELTEKISVFEGGRNNRKNPDNQVASFRIPALLVTDKGTLIAATDQRYDQYADWGNIAQVVKRSTNQGETWGETIKLVDLRANPNASDYRVGTPLTIDTALVQDPVSKRIYAIYDMYPEGQALFDRNLTNKPEYTEIDGQHYLNLYTNDGAATHIVKDGRIYTIDGQATNYRVNMQDTSADYANIGDIYEGDSTVAIDNIYFQTQKATPFKTALTNFIWMQYSEDDGLTWSHPKDITPGLKKRHMKFLGLGPGSGIALHTGDHAGRLVVPAYSVSHTGGFNSQSALVFYSDDQGETWQAGKTMNDGRVLANGTVLQSETMNNWGEIGTEASVVQLNNGDIKMFMRGSKGAVRMATSRDGGATWENDLEIFREVPDVYVQLSAVRVEREGKEYIVLANANGPGRINGHVRIAEVLADGSLNWFNHQMIQDGEFAYNSIQHLGGDDFGILYEHSSGDQNFYSLYYKKFNWEYLTQETPGRPQSKLTSVDYYENHHIGLNFENDILALNNPNLRLSNGNVAEFVSQLDSKKLLYRITEADRGAAILDVATGSLINVNNLPVSIETLLDPASEQVISKVNGRSLQVTGENVYEDGYGAGLDKLMDGSKTTLTELGWGTNNPSNNAAIRLPQTIQIRLPEEKDLHSLLITKRTHANGTMTKYQVKAYLGETEVFDTGQQTVAFDVADIPVFFGNGLRADRIDFIPIEAQTSPGTVNNTMLTIREVQLFELLPKEQVETPVSETPSDPTSPSPRTEPVTILPTVESNEGYSRPAGAIGAITSFTLENGVANISYATGERAQLSLYNDHVFRYYVDKTGNFLVNPAPSREDRPAVIVAKDFPAYQSQYNQQGRLITEDSRYIVETDKVWLIFDKETARMSVYDRLADRYVTKEVLPIQLGTNSASQTLGQEADEYFFGGGMQNGRFTHKGQKINIVNENNWVDGGVASPSPFYWSTKGYGVLRNTFQRGYYDFGTENPDQVSTLHTEDRYDAFFFVNSSPVNIIKDYHELTGAPLVLPEYALYLGHLNAYNRDYWVEVEEGTRGAILLDGKWYKEYQPQQLPENQRDQAVRETLNGEDGSYTFSARAVIDRYKAYDMPISWFLPNDGYGAGYGQTDSLDGNIANLKAFVDYAKENGIKVGLWTQSDLEDTSPNKDVVLHRHINKEVADAGIRAIKTDVAWVGPGYSFGLNGIDEGARRLTEQSGEEATRPFIVSLDGWGGTQRSAAIWSGDQSGGEWEYIRFHIPTYIGLGLSGNPNMGSDMDGIFGGADPIINARDYQWKIFTSIMMNMDGWGAKPKTPFSFDERITDLNRISLKQKSTLMPYAYSIGHEASRTGKPIVRAMFIDFPDQAINYTKDVQYQYMYGGNFLVAPVYKNTAMDGQGNDVRNNIVLPGENEEWIDWYTGEKYQGGQVLNGFVAPLWKAPVFVRNGAIIPMTAAHNNPTEIDRTKRLIQFYPHGTSSFTLYEDDGESVRYKEGQVATTLIESQAGNSNQAGRAILTIHATEGGYADFQREKITELHVAVSQDVEQVTATVAGQPVSLRRATSLEDYQASTNVYFYHDNPIMDTYNPRSQAIRDLNVIGPDQVKIKLAAVDVTQSPIVVTIDGFVNQKAEQNVDPDLAVPTTPVDFTAPESGISSTSIRMEWSAVDNATSYDIERDGILYRGITGSQFVFENFAYGSEHTFRIRAVNAKGESAWSDLLTVQTDNDPWADAIEGITAQTSIESQAGQELAKLFDKRLGAQFHSRWGQAVTFPASIQMDLGGVYEVDRIEYHPRTDVGVNGRITKTYFEVSEDGINWTTDQYYSMWANDNKAKTYTFTVPRARYIRMNIAEGVGNYVSGEELLVFKRPGSRMLIPGDISNDGRISEDDKTSFLNYSGLRREDNDFNYISHADSNKNGLIDAYDISVAAIQLEGGVTSPSQEAPRGHLYFTADKLTLAAGEETTLYLMADELADVNALTTTLMLASQDIEVLGRITHNPEFTKQAENFSAVKQRGEQTNLVFSMINFGQKELMTGSGQVARVVVRALRDLELDMTSQDGILVGNSLRTKALEPSQVRQAVAYDQVPAVPTDLALSRQTSASLSLTWTPDPNALYYVVEQDSPTGYRQVGRTDKSTVDVHNLLPNTSYQFRIKAQNPLGESDYSTVLEASTIAKDASRKIAIQEARANIAEQPNEELSKFIDGDATSLYHSAWSNTNAVPSHLILDLGSSQAVDHILYLPRTNAGNGTITSVQLAISDDGQNWQDVGERAVWEVNNNEKAIHLPSGTQTRYIKLNWLTSVGGFVSGNELTVMATVAEDNPAETPVTPTSPVEGGGESSPTSPVEGGGESSPTSPAEGGGESSPTSPVEGGSESSPTSPVEGGGESSPTSPVDGGGESSLTSPVEGGGESSPTSPVEGGGESSPTSPVDGGGESSPTSPVEGGGESSPTSPVEGGGESSPTSPVEGGGESSSTSPVEGGGESSPTSPVEGGGESSPTSPVEGGGESSPTSPVEGGGESSPTSPVEGGGESSPTSPVEGGGESSPTSPVEGGGESSPTSPVEGGESSPTSPVEGGGESSPTSPVEGGGESSPTSPVEGGGESIPTSPVEGGGESIPTSPVEGGGESSPTSPVEGGGESSPTSPVEGGSESSPTSPVEGGGESIPTSPVEGGGESIPNSPAEGTSNQPLVLEEELELIDEATGIRVQLEAGETSRITKLLVHHKETGSQTTPTILIEEDYDLYDIVLVDENHQPVANTKDTLVVLPLDPGKEVERVIYLPNSEEEEELAFTETTLVTDQQESIRAVVFVAKHFSEYAIVYKPIVDKGSSVKSPALPEGVLPALETAKGDSVNSPALPAGVLPALETAKGDSVNSPALPEGVLPALETAKGDSVTSPALPEGVLPVLETAKGTGLTAPALPLGFLPEEDYGRLPGLSDLVRPMQADHAPTPRIRPAETTQYGKSEKQLPNTGQIAGLSLTVLGMLGLAAASRLKRK